MYTNYLYRNLLTKKQIMRIFMEKAAYEGLFFEIQDNCEYPIR